MICTIVIFLLSFQKYDVFLVRMLTILLVMISLGLFLTLFQVFYALSISGCDNSDYEAYLAHYSSKNGTNNPTYFS